MRKLLGEKIRRMMILQDLPPPWLPAGPAPRRRAAPGEGVKSLKNQGLWGRFPIDGRGSGVLQTLAGITSGDWYALDPRRRARTVLCGTDQRGPQRRGVAG